MDMHRVKDAIPGVWKEVEEEYLKSVIVIHLRLKLERNLGKQQQQLKKKAAKLGS